MDSQRVLMLIRGTRAQPPGLAAEDNERRERYNSALQQFEELVSAARSIGPASQPLAMFYALEQAGQAIVAAHLERSVAASHGLGPDGYDKPLHEFAIKPKGKDGAFQAVAEALGTNGISSKASLGALWSSLPEGAREQIDGVDYPRALSVFPEDRPGPSAILTMTDAAPAWIFPLPEDMSLTPPDGQLERVSAYLADYPSAEGWASPIEGGVPGRKDPAAGFGIRLQWRLPKSSGSAQERFEYVLTHVAPRYQHYAYGVLRPAVGGETVLHPLLTWWLLLYALSMFARYKPGAWVKHLDVATSNNAVRLEYLLQRSLDSVPRLILEALTGKQHLDYKS